MVPVLLTEEPIINLWRRRPYDRKKLMRDSLILLVPIALTFATVFLWFFWDTLLP